MQRRIQRKQRGSLVWVYEHQRITVRNQIDRVPLPDKGKHVVRHGRKATGQRWSLIAGLPKERKSKGQCLRQNIPGSLT